MRRYSGADINKKYSEIVSSYLDKGFTFNCGTMSGSQGEVSKVHLISPDGDYLYNVRLDRTYDWHLDAEIYTVITEFYDTIQFKDETNTFDPFTTIWNNKGTILDKENFYSFNSHGKKVFGDDEFYESVRTIRRERRRKKSVNTKTVFDAKYYPLVLSYLKKQPKFKSVKVSDIQEVQKCIDVHDKPVYSVRAKNKWFTLH